MRGLRLPNLPIIFVILLTFAALASAQAYTLSITVQTDKHNYLFGETVHIYGTLKQDGSPVSNGLVAIQVNNPNGMHAIRTIPIGTPPEPWLIDIIEFLSCDIHGNPQDSFRRGPYSFAYFKVILRNQDTVNAHAVTVTVNLYDLDSASFGIAFQGTEIAPGKEHSYFACIPIPEEVALGTAVAYVNAYNRLPQFNGVPYCAERSVLFTIVDGAGGGNLDSVPACQTTYPASTDGAYELTIKLLDDVPLGDYIAYATAPYQAISSTTFGVIFCLADINRDGIVNILDAGTMASAFRSQPGDPRWNPNADLNNDDIINILDVGILAVDFGKARP